MEKKMEKAHSHCPVVPTPGVWINPLDENEKLLLFKGNKPHWRWLKDPREKMEYREQDVLLKDYYYYSSRFSKKLNISQGPDYGRSEDMSMKLDGYGPKDI